MCNLVHVLHHVFKQLKIICRVRHYVETHVSHGTHEADSVGGLVYFAFDGIICDVVYVQGTLK